MVNTSCSICGAVTYRLSGLCDSCIHALLDAQINELLGIEDARHQPPTVDELAENLRRGMRESGYTIDDIRIMVGGDTYDSNWEVAHVERVTILPIVTKTNTRPLELIAKVSIKDGVVNVLSIEMVEEDDDEPHIYEDEDDADSTGAAPTE